MVVMSGAYFRRSRSSNGMAVVGSTHPAQTPRNAEQLYLRKIYDRFYGHVGLLRGLEPSVACSTEMVRDWHPILAGKDDTSGKI